MHKFVPIAAIAAATLATGFGSQAQERSAGPPNWQVGVGAGGIVTPDYRGSSTYRSRTIPAITARYGDAFALNGLEATYVVARSGPWRMGAQGRFRFGQDEEDDRTALRGLGDVGASLEAGAFIGYGEGPLSLRASFAQDVIDGHGGQVATLSAAYTAPLHRTAAGPVLISAGPSVTWVSGRFNHAYYGVDAGQSARSGLPVYRPGSGLESAGLSVNLVAPLSRRATVVAIAGYDRLLGAAADSPRVRGRGSRDQATVGAFFTYSLF